MTREPGYYWVTLTMLRSPVPHVGWFAQDIRRVSWRIEGEWHHEDDVRVLSERLTPPEVKP